VVLGSVEANREGNIVAGVWRRCILQTDFKKVVSPEVNSCIICEKDFV